MTPAELQQLSIAALEDLKGVDVLSIDVSDRTTVTDWMVVATGTSQRHVKSLANEVSEKAKAAGVRPLGVEGDGDADWVLVDLGDVIVHIMTRESRDFYSLEKLWSVTAAERENDDTTPTDDAAAN
ncbi:ribosome silencing factor [Chromatiales bacterium (ex Bugula neritina AB1)]|nr:ribosome silencing factor [Chromatiales bacterium (ex Bugula neritina AB1)]